MRRLAVMVLVAAAAACDDDGADRDEGALDRDPGISADTTVIERTMQDTVIITRDTTVSVDTTVRRGGTPVDSDTTRDD
ncbi:MAG: hypothetical protein ACM357_04670 [Gemmatimonadota bacterium]